MRPPVNHFKLTLCLLLLFSTECLCATEVPTLPSAQWIADHQGHLNHLFTALGTTHKQVAQAKALWNQGDQKQAVQELLLYYQTRATPLPNLEPSLDMPLGDKAKAQRIHSGFINLFGQDDPIPRTAEGSINWNFRGPNEDKEWAWAFNRHLYFNDLLIPENPEYIDVISEHLSDWVIHNPYPNRTNFTPAWRALEVARRIQESWAIVFQQLQGNPHFSPEAQLLLLASIPDHADTLQNHASIWGGNHILTEKGALIIAALVWPEFEKAPLWLQSGLDLITREILNQTYPDGAFHELTNHYQRIVLDSVQHILNHLHSSNYPIPAPLVETTASMWNYFALVMKPSGHGPMNNASDMDFNANNVLNASKYFHRPDWEFMASNGAGGTPGPSTLDPLTFFPWAGHAVMRDSWASNANWAFFDLGPEGSAHVHADALHLSAVIEGEDFLVDAGRYTYHPGDWNAYFKGPQAHNVLTIKNYQRREPPPISKRAITPFSGSLTQISWIAGELWFDPLEQASTAQSIRQRRLIVFIPQHGWVVFDQVLTLSPQQLDFHWHFAPNTSLDQMASHFSLIPSPFTENATVNTFFGQESPFIAGWHSSEYQEKQPAPESQYSFQTAQPTLVAWVIGKKAIDMISIKILSSRKAHLSIGAETYLISIDPLKVTQERP